MGTATVTRRKLLIGLGTVALATLPGRAWAKGNAARSTSIPQTYRQVGAFCDVPARLLYAVALGESGRKVAGQWTAWPWTLNVQGRGFYFDSRERVFEALMQAITEGRSVDVGPMQLNWRWKYDWLPSPWLATEPVFNIGTGARIIRAHYDRNPNAGWFEAAGRYHREANRPQDFVARERYIGNVKRAWGRIL